MNFFLSFRFSKQYDVIKRGIIDCVVFSPEWEVSFEYFQLLLIDCQMEFQYEHRQYCRKMKTGINEDR
jgi:hypothetical protein